MLNKIHNLDCLEGLKLLPDNSIDLVFADLPYGVTNNKWDKPINLNLLWPLLLRVSKPTAPFVFTAIQPFASALINSNPKLFKYEMIWVKNKPSGFLNAKKQPLRAHENALVFYRKQPKYQPQLTHNHPPVHFYAKHTSDGSNYGKTKPIKGGGSTSRYPTSILNIPVVNNDSKLRIHPTQKPLELIKYFILTYTQPGDLILDPVAGSGSSLIAAKELNRNFIGFEIDPDIYVKANKHLHVG